MGRNIGHEVGLLQKIDHELSRGNNLPHKCIEKKLEIICCLKVVIANELEVSSLLLCILLAA